MIRFTLIILTFLSACQKDETISGQIDPQDNWTLIAMNGVKPDQTITINFPEKGKIVGKAPCNNYFSNQTAPLPWFEAKNIGSTKRGCPHLQLEQQYFDTLAKMTVIEVLKDTLVLKNESGQEMVYKNLGSD